MNAKYIKILFYLYVAGLIILSVIPFNTAATLNNITIVHLRGDYFLHALLFLPWTVFNLKFNKNSWFWLFSGLLFCAAVETIQYALPYRSFNINDLLANAVGVILGQGVLFSLKGILNYKEN